VPTLAPPKSVSLDATALKEAMISIVLPGLRAIGVKETAAIQADLSVPVGRDALGNVIQRSAPGEPPRMEEDILRQNIEWDIVREGEGIVLEITAHRPAQEANDDEDAAVILEYGGVGNWGPIAARPFMTPAMLRIEGYAEQEIVKHAK
jgi:hypothetical protein